MIILSLRLPEGIDRGGVVRFWYWPAGKIFPVGYLTESFGGLNYGEYQKDGCKVIVSSGAAGWGFPIRTQGKCEYVVIHLREQ